MLRNHRRVGLIVVALLFVAVLAPVAVYAAGGTFTDDDTSVFEADIEWMASTGITFGCNPPTNDNYCPDKSVTRGQMAAFMHRLADNQVVDAGKLGGEEPEHYQSLVFGNDIEFGLITTPLSGGNQRWAEIDFEVPAAGMLLINTSVSAYDPDSEEQSLWWLQVDDSVCKNSSPSTDSVAFGYLTTPGSSKRQGVAFTGVAEVTAGAHSVTLCGRGPAGNTQVYEPNITVLFSTGGEILTP
jgi:hypothetical protein